MQKWLLTQLSPIILGLVGLAAGILVMQPRPWWWLGLGLMCAAFGWVWAGAQNLVPIVADALRQPRNVGRFEVVPGKLLAELACFAAVFALATMMLPEAAMGERPATHDHSVHYYKAWQYWTDFLSEGRINGWSHRWFAGYPVPYHYPVGGDLWVLAVRVASLGMLSLSQAFGVAVWLFWVISGYAVFRLGASAFDSRIAGLLAGALYLMDDGAFRASGWEFAINWGVWPQSFAVALGVLSVAQLPGLLRSNNLWRWSAFAFLLGCSLVMHPLMVVHFAAVGPLALIAWAVADRDGRSYLGGAFKIVTGYAAGILLSGFWLFVYIAYKDYSESAMGILWKDLYEVGSGFHDMTAIDAVLGLVLAFGLVGVISAMLAGRHFGRLLVGMLALVFVITGTHDFVAAFHLYEAMDGMEYMHFQRFQTMAKPYFFVAAGYGIVTVIRGARQQLSNDGEQRPTRQWQTALQGLLIGLLVGPVVAPLLHHTYRTDIDRDLTYASEREDRADRAALVDWFRQEIAKDDRFYRVGLRVGRDEHGYHDLGAEIDRPTYKLGFTPASTYRHKVAHDGPNALDLMNVRYVIVRGKWSEKGFDEVADFGNLRVYEAKNWRESPVTVNGTGAVELVSMTPDEVVFRAGPGATGTFIAHIAYYPNWRATRDGTSVKVSPSQLPGLGDNEFITVPLQEGTYRFRFVVGSVEWGSRAATLLALLLILGIPIFGRRIVAHARVGGATTKAVAFVGRHEGAIATICVTFPLLAGLGGLLGLAAWRPPVPDLSSKIRKVHFDTVDEMRSAEVALIDAEGESAPCDQWMDRAQCGEGRNEQSIHTTVERFAGSFARRCIRADPPASGKLAIGWDIPPGEELVGFYAFAGRRDQPVTLEVLLDGKTVETLAARKRGMLNRFSIPLSNASRVDFHVAGKRVLGRKFCFNAQVADIAEPR